MEAAGRAVARAVRRALRALPGAGARRPGEQRRRRLCRGAAAGATGWPVRLAALAPPRDGSDAAGAARHWHGPMAAVRSGGGGARRPGDRRGVRRRPDPPGRRAGRRDAAAPRGGSSRSMCHRVWTARPGRRWVRRRRRELTVTFFPPETGAPAAAWPRPVRPDRAGRYRHSRRRAGRHRARDLRQPAVVCGGCRCYRTTGTNIPAAMSPSSAAPA